MDPHLKAVKGHVNNAAWTVRSGATVSKWTRPTWDHTHNVSVADGLKEVVLPIGTGWNDASSYTTEDKEYVVRGMFRY